jgi:hypothetical protein
MGQTSPPPFSCSDLQSLSHDMNWSKILLLRTLLWLLIFHNFPTKHALCQSFHWLCSSMVIWNIPHFPQMFALL